MNKVRKFYWGGFRLVMYVTGVVTILSGGTFLYVAAPLTSRFFFSDFAFWKYLRYYHKIFFSCFLFVKHSLTSKSTGYCVMLPLCAPPLMGPDMSLVRLSDEWKGGEHHCAECHKCCDKFGCLLVTDDHRCLSYGSPWWRYFNCGRFPESREQLKYYECPKWVI